MAFHSVASFCYEHTHAFSAPSPILFLALQLKSFDGDLSYNDIPQFT